MDVKSKVKLTSYEELFGKSENEKEKSGEVKYLKDKLMEFPSHPFRVVHDEAMNELIESVKEHGILVPILVIYRNKGVFFPETGYYIVAGHRRYFAAGEAGLLEVPVNILDITDKEATDYMIDTNLQRPEIYPSELAKAYKLQQEANRRAAIKIDESSEQARKRQRYIRLTFLIDGFLDEVDAKHMQISTGYELSFLSFAQQLKLYSYLKSNDMKVSPEQAKELKKEVKKHPDTDFTGNIILDKIFKGLMVMVGDEPELDQEEDYNIPGQTSIETDFPEYLPDRHVKSELQKEEANTVTETDTEEVDIEEPAEAFEVKNDDPKAVEEVENKKLSVEVPVMELVEEEPETKLTELPKLKNTEQRKEWLEKYKEWGIWYRDEHIDVNYYKFDFSDGSRLIVAEYPQRRGYWSAELRDEHYYHLLEQKKEGYTKHDIYDEKYRPRTTSETELIEFLKNLQKK